MKPIALCVGVAVITSALFGAEEGQLKISSSAFAEGGNIPSKFTCDGGDTSPPLKIEAVPAGAKSLVLVVQDPDAPGGLFTHWLVWNFDAKTSSIAEDNAPSGVQGKNDFGKTGYGGPCPPSGAHRYYFKVFALDQPLSLGAGATRKDLDRAMKNHVIAQG